MIKARIIKNVVAIRKAKKINQTTLAHLTDKDRQNIHKFEKGQSNPTLQYIIAICNALEVNFEDVVKQ